MSDSPLNYKSPEQRVTKRTLRSDEVNALILQQMEAIGQDVIAENLWMEIKATGHSISVSTIYTKLKKLIEAGLVEKKILGYNRRVYNIVGK